MLSQFFHRFFQIWIQVKHYIHLHLHPIHLVNYLHLHNINKIIIKQLVYNLHIYYNNIDHIINIYPYLGTICRQAMEEAQYQMV